ncbi:MAG: OmpA family protein [Bacteroidetes bacterium]|jgi:outer membrane protein OmpA-like peptidoglycan-associated protein|nr:OmpA family protein [Bacteroidota bacterium]
MKRIVIYTILVSILTIGAVSAQTENAPNALSFRYTLSNFQLPLNDFDNWDAEDYTPGVELTYGRYLNNRLNLAIPLKLAKADLPIDETNVRSDDFMVSLDALLQLKLADASGAVYPYIFAGVGGMLEADNDNAFNFEIPAGLGLNFRLSPQFYLSLQSQYRFDFTENRNQLQHGLGFTAQIGPGEAPEPPIADKDLDGVADKDDQCPDVPGSPELMGCPDTDGDGVVDKYDECPDAAGLASLKGCPDGDSDGIVDKDDECPEIAGTAALNGCPDTDGDGVGDADDECPNVAGTLNGCPDGDGDGFKDADDECPEVAGKVNGCPDTDGDGILDKNDKCPNTAGPGTTNGCPELKKEDVEILTFATQAVQFETGSGTLKPASFSILDQVADVLGRYPDYKCTIGGHTDSIGSAESNMTLSQNRAKTCYDYLINKGVSSVRLSYTGYGETRPIENNKYKDGREKNRRVEFDIYHD